MPAFSQSEVSALTDPFSLLGIEPTADVEEIRQAYHNLAKKNHPDQFRDEQSRQEATARMVAVNLAYEEAIHLASGQQNRPYTAPLSCEDAVIVARRLVEQGRPDSALRQLLRSETRSAAWYGLQGDILMAMEQWESAEQSYRAAVRLDGNTLSYRRGALDALVALRKSRTFSGRVRKWLKGQKRIK
ncbi:MAG: J domain-containing protein [Clostridia bacterium]|nr:J domain-containing protein [Clostridia bacterium]